MDMLCVTLPSEGSLQQPDKSFGSGGHSPYTVVGTENSAEHGQVKNQKLFSSSDGLFWPKFLATRRG